MATKGVVGGVLSVVILWSGLGVIALFVLFPVPMSVIGLIVLSVIAYQIGAHPPPPETW